MTRRTVCLTALLLAGFTLGSSQTARAANIVRLTLQSQTGDFIGQGGSFDLTYTSPPGTISAQIRRTLPDGSPAEILFVLDGAPGIANSFALLFFGTDGLGIPIQPGVYTDAQRADFALAGHPGLDVSFQNRGSNTLTGNFTITDVSFTRDSSGALSLATFDATFEQHSGGATPALFGRIQFNEPFNAVPEPSSFVLLGIGTLSVLGAGWRGRKPAVA
jgi:hypothetical protein